MVIRNIYIYIRITGEGRSTRRRERYTPREAVGEGERE
jgi:hypothetical protein